MRVAPGGAKRPADTTACPSGRRTAVAGERINLGQARRWGHRLSGVFALRCSESPMERREGGSTRRECRSIDRCLDSCAQHAVGPSGRRFPPPSSSPRSAVAPDAGHRWPTIGGCSRAGSSSDDRPPWGNRRRARRGALPRGGRVSVARVVGTPGSTTGECRARMAVGPKGLDGREGPCGRPAPADQNRLSSDLGGSTRRCRSAKATASSLEWTRSLPMMFWTCVRSVFGAM